MARKVYTAKDWRNALIAGVFAAPFMFWFVSCIHNSGNDPNAFTLSDEFHARDLVRAQLKDPDSAQFDSMKQGTDTKIIYGRVNAKNSFGAYIGYRAFRVYPDGRVELSQ
jgi:hypothetical protein